MAEAHMEPAGLVAGYFARAGAALVRLSAPLRVGDVVYVKGHTTDFQQVVESMQADRQAVQEAGIGQEIGLRVAQKCRRHDLVYKLVSG